MNDTSSWVGNAKPIFQPYHSTTAAVCVGAGGLETAKIRKEIAGPMKWC
jgi:hypothetical protein